MQVHIPADDHYELYDHQHQQHPDQCGVGNSSEEEECDFKAGYHRQDRPDHRVFAYIGMSMLVLVVQFLAGHANEPFFRYAG